jgi:hypothetical protein
LSGGFRRKLTLAGYEVYRFGAHHLLDEQQAPMLTAVFAHLSTTTWPTPERPTTRSARRPALSAAREDVSLAGIPGAGRSEGEAFPAREGVMPYQWQ